MEEDKYDVVLKDYEGNITGKVSVSEIARCLTHEQFVYLFDNFINYGMKDYREGLNVGLDFRFTHRTLQGSAFRFALGFIVGLSQQEYTDARNEIPVNTAKKIAKMVESGELGKGFFI